MSSPLDLERGENIPVIQFDCFCDLFSISTVICFCSITENREHRSVFHILSWVAGICPSFTVIPGCHESSSCHAGVMPAVLQPSLYVLYVSPDINLWLIGRFHIMLLLPGPHLWPHTITAAHPAPGEGRKKSLNHKVSRTASVFPEQIWARKERFLAFPRG